MGTKMGQDQNISLQRNSEHYNHITHAWQHLLGDNFHWGYFENQTQNLERATDALIELVAAPMDLDEESNLLDVGCGIGSPARYLREKYKCSVVGFSTSSEGIKEATERSREIDGLSFFERNALDNGFKNAEFSSVMLLEMSHLIQDKAKLIAESARVLEIGGIISLCDLILQRRLSAREIVEKYEDLKLLEQGFGKARLETLEVYKKIFESCGLELISCKDITREVTPTLVHWKQNAKMNALEISESVSNDGLAVFEKSCDLLESYYNDGAWGYGVISARKISDAPTDNESIANNLY